MTQMMELYLPSFPQEHIKTINGEIPCLKWLELEKIRIEKDVDRVAVIVKKLRKVSLWVNRIEGENDRKDRKLSELLEENL